MLSFSLNPVVSHAKETISWLWRPFPPVFIDDGPDANKGYGDFVVNLLISNLDEYNHNFLKSNVARSLMLFKNQKNVCDPAILKRPDREPYIEFSIPAYVLIPNGVVIQNHQLNKFRPYMNDEGLFILEKAITQSDLKLGISTERAYGGIIDEILLENNNHENVYINYYEEDAHLYKMLQAGRIDYTIAYPMEAQYFAKKIKNGEKLVCLQIEGMPEYYFGYVGAPKNEWGKGIIKKINTILKENRNTTEYHAAYEYWLDENSIKRYRKYVKDVYGNF